MGVGGVVSMHLLVLSAFRLDVTATVLPVSAILKVSMHLLVLSAFRLCGVR